MPTPATIVPRFKFYDCDVTLTAAMLFMAPALILGGL